MGSTSRRAVAGLVAAVTVLAGTGAALAHGGPGLLGFGGGGGGNQTDLLNAVAKNVGVSNTAFRKAVKDALKAQVDAQVASGALTKAQGDDLKARIDSGTVRVGVGPAGLGWGELGVLDAASSFLVMSAADIRTALASGKSLADLATAKGKTAAALEDAIVARATAQLAAAVAAGDLTAAQRDTILTRLKSSVDALVTQTRGLRDGRGFGAAGFRLGHGFLQGRALNHR
jgi:hypothetical protein